MLKQIGWQGQDERSTFTVADGTVNRYDLSKGNESTVPIKIINTQNYYSAIPLLKIQFTNVFICVQTDLYT